MKISLAVLTILFASATNMLHMDGEDPSGFLNSFANSRYTAMTSTVTPKVTTSDDGAVPRTAEQIALVPVTSLYDIIV